MVYHLWGQESRILWTIELINSFQDSQGLCWPKVLIRHQEKTKEIEISMLNKSLACHKQEELVWALQNDIKSCSSPMLYTSKTQKHFTHSQRVLEALRWPNHNTSSAIYQYLFQTLIDHWQLPSNRQLPFTVKILQPSSITSRTTKHYTIPILQQVLTWHQVFLMCFQWDALTLKLSQSVLYLLLSHV